MISKWLFSGAFLFELSSWASVFADLPFGQALALYLFAHGLGSALLCVGVWLLLPRRYKFPLPWSPLFLFSLAFFVPLIGAVGVAAAVFPALYLPRQLGEQAWQAMGVPELPFRPKEKRLDMMFSDGGLQDVLRHAPDPNQRLTAIFATRRMPGKEAIPILKLALRDPADDVRLLAYSMLDQKESRINQRIEAALGRLAGATPARRGALHGTLARWYWELAYLGLAQGSVLEHILEQAREHTDQALRGAPSADLHLLAGRIALEQGRLEDAGRALQAAEEAGIDSAQLAPFRAEVAFFQRRYRDIPGFSPECPTTCCNGRPSRPWRDTGHDRTHRSDGARRRCLPAAGGHLALCPRRRLQLGQPVDPRSPDLTFSVFFIGGQKDAYGKRHYPIPDNVLHIEEHFLETAWSSPNPQTRQGSSETEKALRDLHRFFHYPETPDVEEGDALLDLLAEGRIGREDFLHSKASWEAITAGYERYCTDPSFVNYFWTLRSMQAPVFMLAEAARRMPRARMLHSISTGYAGLLGCILQRRWRCRYLLSEHGIYTKERKIDLAQANWIAENPDEQLSTGLDAEVSYIRRLWIRFFRACRPAHLSRRQSDRRPLRRQPPAPGTRWRRATAHPGDPQRHRPRCLGRRPRTAAAGDSAGGRAGRPGSADQGREDLHPRHARGGQRDAGGGGLDRRSGGGRSGLCQRMPQPGGQPRPAGQGEVPRFPSDRRGPAATRPDGPHLDQRSAAAGDPRSLGCRRPGGEQRRRLLPRTDRRRRRRRSRPGSRRGGGGDRRPAGHFAGDPRPAAQSRSAGRRPRRSACNGSNATTPRR